MKDLRPITTRPRGSSCVNSLRRLILILLLSVVGSSGMWAATLDPLNMEAGPNYRQSTFTGADGTDVMYQGAGTWYDGDFSVKDGFSLQRGILKASNPYVEFTYHSWDGGEDDDNDCAKLTVVAVIYEDDPTYHYVAIVPSSAGDLNHYDDGLSNGLVTRISWYKGSYDKEYSVMRYYPPEIGNNANKKVEYVVVMSCGLTNNRNGSHYASYDTSVKVDNLNVFLIPVSYDYGTFDSVFTATETPNQVEFSVSDVDLSSVVQIDNSDTYTRGHHSISDRNVSWTNAYDDILIENGVSTSARIDYTISGNKLSGSRSVAVDYSQSRKYTAQFGLSRTFTTGTNMGDYNDVYTFTQSIKHNVQIGPNQAVTKATTLEAQPDIWQKKVKLVWESTSSTNSDGKWYVFRYPKNEGEGSRVLLTESGLAASTVSWTDDTSPEYDVEFVYELSFGLNAWGALSSPVPFLTESIETCLAREIPINLSIDALENNGASAGLKLTWEHAPLYDNDVSFVVNRRVRPVGEDGVPLEDDDPLLASIPFEPIAEVARTSSQATSHNYTDEAPSNVCDFYDYKITTTILGKDFESNCAWSQIAGGSRVKSVSTSKGTYTNVVKVTWEVQQVGSDPTKFIVLRRQLGTDSGFSKVYTTQGTASEYYFEDNTVFPGNFYEYKVQAFSKCDENTFTQSNEISNDGFSQSTGIISGRITYGTGTAVEGVKVVLTQSAEENVKSQFYSLNVGHANSGATYDFTGETIANPFQAGKPFSIQLWANVNGGITVGNGTSAPAILSTEAFLLYGQYDAASNSYNLKIRVSKSGGGTVLGTGSLNIPADKYCHLTLSYDGVDKWTLRKVNDDGEGITSYPVVLGSTSGLNAISTFNVANAFEQEDIEPYTFKGNVDEIRVWSKELSDDEILSNHNRLLTGSEKELALYWAIDEGIDGQTTAYDYSKTGGVPNERHGEIRVGTEISSKVPEADRFALYGLTDAEGNYVIRGIPFSGEGTNYIVTPLMGIHEFSPAYVTRFVSANSLTHSGADMEDVSSFPVSGVIYYEGTNYPVEGVNLYIDGSICNKDGEAITTNDKGEYTISVPIGDHYISVSKNGHTFVNDGRYPVDPNDVGTRFTFDREVKGLTFYDNTTVIIAGRIVGGEIEESKPLGFGESVNNIGVASITLTASDHSLNWVDIGTELVPNWTNGESERSFSTPVGVPVSSNATAGAGEHARKITITTDPATGEFAALLPPLRYTISGIEVASNEAIKFENLPILDATNPLITYTDSIATDDGIVHKFEYNTSLIKAYRTPPTFTVSDSGAAEGAFGEQIYEVSDVNGNKTRLTLYTVGSDGTINYTYGMPIFVQSNSYKFLLKGYEEYVNNDGATPVSDRVPLSGTIVTIQNQLSAENGVRGALDETAPGEIVELAENELQLDENGEAVYKFITGFPNIVEEQGFARGLNIAFENNGQTVNWDQSDTFKAVVLGALPTGTNFVTAGPDRILMILRDPGGSNSSASWTTGTTITESRRTGGTFTSNNSVETVSHLGTEFKSSAGTFLYHQITEIDSKVDMTVGIHVSTTFEDYSTEVTTTTLTRTVSTSSETDYVGAHGDIFIGTGTNILFGNARSVGFVKDEVSDQYVLKVSESKITSTQFTTAFNYSLNYVENILIPNLESLRNSKLIQVSEAEYSTFKNETKENLYITTLSPDDERFGSANDDVETWGDRAVFSMNGPSYRVIPPTVLEPGKSYTDSVGWLNNQIELWVDQLYNNEKAKVTAIENRSKYLDVNLSIDNGVSVEGSFETTKSEEDGHTSQTDILGYFGLETGVELNGTGVEAHLFTETGGGRTAERFDATENSSVLTYTLVDVGLNNGLTVDVYNAPDGFGPIFVNRGGQTSCPYEDEVLTSYYRPGTSISTKTMTVEEPQLSVDNAIATDVPAGGVANYVIHIANVSETGDDVWFDLAVLDETNPDGAKIMMDGAVLTNGRAILTPGGKDIVKSIQLQQTDESVLDYEDIKIVLKSQCQGDPTGIFPVIADTISITAHFVPSCSDITLSIPETTMNVETGTDLSMKVSDINLTYRNFKGVRIQYKYANDVQWSLAQEFVVDEADKTNNNLLIEGSPINYQFDMKSFADGEYTFRAITICDYGAGEVFNESAEITVIKDMARPQILGTPNPAGGILSAGDDIFVTFNENIRSGALTKEGNFIVSGILNGAAVDHSTTLQLTGAETAAATTEAAINLSKQSFAFDMWLKLESSGTILEHGVGANKFTVALDNNKHLLVGIGADTYTSDEAVPTDKWVYLTVSYEYSEGASKLFARVSYDAFSTNLFFNDEVSDYTGNGIIAVGKGLTGSIHELALWSYARTLDESQRDMHQTKYAYTPNLIGYWQMNEGSGLRAMDTARNRHMVTTGNWALNNVNYAVTFDGSTSYAKLNTTACSMLNTDDYALEMWFKGAAQTNATIFSVNTTDLALKANVDGKLAFVADGVETVLSDKDYFDGVWHHFALNVLRNGTATVYVDGIAVKTLAASGIPALASDAIILGATRTYAEGTVIELYSDFFDGSIDEVRLWNAHLTKSVIEDNINVRLDAEATSGLVAYYPFETLVRDAISGQISATFTLEDQSGNDAVGDAVNVVQAATAPGLKEAPAETALDFSFTASDKQVYITLNDDPARLEGSTVNITLREVYDMNYNRMQDVVWSVYVNQNRLNWSEGNIAIERSIDDDDNEFVVSVVNSGSEIEQWALTGVPNWLEISSEQGSVKPLESEELKFTIPQSTPIGKYESTIYLSGNDGIYNPLVVSLKVTGTRPNWEVNPSDFELSMNMVGQLQVDGIVTDDSDDLIAAFVGEMCVGIASPIYYSRYDSHYVHMVVYGNETELGQPVTFKMWDASTGDIYPQVATSSDVTFISNQLTGSMSAPFIWNAREQREQAMSFVKGWNWMSLYVTPDSDAASLNNIFGTNVDSFSQIKSEDKFSEPADGVWIGTVGDMTVGKLYKVQTNSAVNMSIYGKTLVSAENPITIMPNWNWLGFNSSSRMYIDEALAGLNPQTGDLIKSQHAFSVYEDYQWVGTIASLVPGQGYMYHSVDSESKTFTYPAVSNLSRRAPAMSQGQSLEPEVFTPVGVNMYPGTMTIIAEVYLEGEAQTDVEVGAFVGDECRGAIKSMDSGLVFLSVFGEIPNEKIIFRVYINGVTYIVDQNMFYVEDSRHGKVKEPYRINVSKDMTGIEEIFGPDAELVIYNMHGVFMGDEIDNLANGFYIINGKKVFIVDGRIFRYTD